MEILITGGAGFIGSHLAKESMNDQVYKFMTNQVTVIDNLSTGRIENLSNTDVKFICDSVTNEVMMDKLISECDVVYHLAANVGVERVAKTPLTTLIDDIKGTEIVLRLAKKYWKKVLIMSSSEVYGYGDAPQYEDQENIFPSDIQSCYAEVKLINEKLALSYHREYGLPVVVIRLFNTTGEGQLSDYGMVIPRFIQKKIRGEVAEIYGNGEQSRCFSYIDDITCALIDIMDRKEAYGKIFNLGSEQEVTVKDLAILIDVAFNFEKKRKFDVMRRKPDISRIKRVLGYDPIKTSLNQIIVKVEDYERTI